MRASVYRRILCLLVCLVLLAGVSPAHTLAEGRDRSRQPVRVGVVEQDGYAMRDSDGVFRGRDIEFISKIAQYALLDLEYTVYPNFTQLLAALEQGEIDLTLGISRNAERDQLFLFSEHKLAEGYVTIKVHPEDDTYEFGNLSQINGMTLGYSAGSSTVNAVTAWAEELGIQFHLLSFTGEKELRDGLERGEIDGLISTGELMDDCRAILTINAQSYYVAINRSRRDLKLLIDSAMNRIFEESPDYASNLYYGQEKRRLYTSIALSADQKAYLLAHREQSVRIAVLAYDPPYNVTEDGKADGIVRAYYDEICRIMNETVPDFSVTYLSYDSFDEAAAAVAAGEADVFGMVRLSAVEASRLGLILTAPLQYNSILQLSIESRDTLLKNRQYRAAALASDIETLRFVMGVDAEKYQWVPVSSIPEAYEELRLGRADMILSSLPQATWLVNQQRSGSFNVSTLPYTGWDLTAAVNAENTEFGEIISKMARSRALDISGIISDKTATRTDIITFLQRIPMQFIVTFFTVLLLIALLVFLLILRNQHLRSRQRQKDALIQSQKELLHAYEYDGLTGLANRNTAVRRATELLRDGDQFCMVLMYINNLHFVNESFGYEHGDAVICDLAERLLAYARRSPTERYLSRYSGDEFLFLFRNLSISDAEPIVEELRSIGTQAVELSSASSKESEAFYVRPQVGFGLAGSDGVSDPEQIIQHCAIAANAARQEGGSAVHVYAEELKTQLSRANEVREELFHALNNDGFIMVYQPKVDLQTGTVIGSEALIRMKNGKRGPGEFIPVAESSGYIQRIGRLTTRLVVKQLAAWREQGMELHPVSINYSSKQLGDSGYVAFLLQLLQEYQVPPSLVEIEVTESLMISESDVSLELFRQLHNAGIRLLLDDFGSGYSSLHYLSFIPVDIVKLDKSLVDTFLLDDTGEKNIFVRDLIELMHDLGKQVIIEGVEEVWQAEKLKAFGCDAIQGYYFSKPLPPDALPSFALKPEQRRVLDL